MTITLTVDVVLLTLKAGELYVALFKRDCEPFAERWALPGGFIHEQEDDTTLAAAARVLLAKTGLVAPYLEEFGTASGPARDARGWSLTVVFFALAPLSELEDKTNLVPMSKLPGLPFDHASIIGAVVARVRSKANYSSLPVFLCEREFTVRELQAVYEALQEGPLNLAGFRRKLDEFGILEEVQGKTKQSGRRRPAQLYRVAKPFRGRLSVREREI